MAGSLTISTLNDSSGVLATQNGMTGIAKAWVYFLPNAGTPSIQTSFNVSSITYNAAGNYTANFTTAMANATYAAIGSSDYPGVWNEVNSGTRTTSALQFYTPLSTNANPTNYGRCSVVIFSA
jgi:hypothetical protein